MLSITQLLVSLLLLPIAVRGSLVNTTSGLIIGHVSASRPSVDEYLGIRYAQAPVGDLRFAPPVRFTSDAPFEAANFTPSKSVHYPNGTALQQIIIANFASQNVKLQSEDCLKLNVWAKNTPLKKKPVLLWIHGGRFSLGSTNNPFYQGQYIADKEDIVVVSMNYRLNVFGYPSAPGAPQNVALLDQRMAIEWVRDNIAAFGGDPSRITLIGHSAGGAMTDYYTYKHIEDPIVHAVIPMSGTALSFSPNTQAQSEKYWYILSKALGCGSSGDTLPCVRSKPATDVLAAVSKVPPEPSNLLPQPVFHPTVDEELVFSNYEERAAKGMFAKLPYLVGNGDYEAGYYKVSAYALNITTISQKAWHLFNLAGFTCPNAREARYRAARGVPTWRYMYFGEWPNSILFPGSGSYHGCDVAQLFGTAEDVSNGTANTETEAKFSAYMMHAFATFAADPREGLSKLGWPRYRKDGKGNALVGLAFRNGPSATYLPPLFSDKDCPLVGTNTSYAHGGF
ncbi:acetylcholinesterase [Nannizzia gypsea CBS 118893]|uniref:Carboxylic ester hydrolase n=1 Tax=Arthroderma gypseum (strain ATCC MYA-4604 / CBS 118893) TaxID=535722 RepID=E4US79_ARTGP|nr:acetylcholinesterase [Nannizzia gypsea CBS 118893]EFR01283.1 acetylcholinesterase [Nannizzia gypsea CBS 118893]